MKNYKMVVYESVVHFNKCAEVMGPEWRVHSFQGEYGTIVVLWESIRVIDR